MAVLDDYRGATLKEWQKDRSLSNLKQAFEKPAELHGVPALHTELTYTRDGIPRRYESVFALWNGTQYAIEYDASGSSARDYEKVLHNVIDTFEFDCQANQGK